jgi:hypothetical protein
MLLMVHSQDLYVLLLYLVHLDLAISFILLPMQFQG